MSTIFFDRLNLGPGAQRLIKALTGQNMKSASRQVELPESVDSLAGMAGEFITTAQAAWQDFMSCSVTEQEEDGHWTAVFTQKKEEEGEEAKEVAAA
jgi:hypothetical protein